MRPKILYWIDHEAHEFNFIWEFCEVRKIKVKLCGSIDRAIQVLSSIDPETCESQVAVLLDALVPFEHGREEILRECEGVAETLGVKAVFKEHMSITGQLVLLHNKVSSSWRKHVEVFSVYGRSTLLDWGFLPNLCYHHKATMMNTESREELLKHLDARYPD